MNAARIAMSTVAGLLGTSHFSVQLRLDATLVPRHDAATVRRAFLPPGQLVAVHRRRVLLATAQSDPPQLAAALAEVALLERLRGQSGFIQLVGARPISPFDLGFFTEVRDCAL